MADLSDKVSESEEMSSRKSSPERSNGGSNLKTCIDCGTSRTPLWRSGPAGPKTLCNACGIRSRKKRRALLGINKDDKDKRGRKASTAGSNSSSSSSKSSKNDVVHQVVRQYHRKNSVANQVVKQEQGQNDVVVNQVVKQYHRKNGAVNQVVKLKIKQSTRNDVVDQAVVDKNTKNDVVDQVMADKDTKTDVVSSTPPPKYGESLRKKLMAFGRDFVMQRPRSKKSNAGQRRKMGEVEQAAVLLMALSCGSVYA